MSRHPSSVRAFVAHDVLDDRFRGLALLVIERKEQHPDAILAARRQFEAELARFAA